MTDLDDDEAELGIIEMVRGEEIPQSSEDQVIIPQDEIFTAREEIHNLHVAQNVAQYMVAIVMATRDPLRLSAELRSWIEVGSSPRASIALDKCTRAHAWLAGRDYADPDDVRAIAHAVLRHRMILSYEAVAEGISTDQVIGEILKLVAVA